MEHRSLTSPPLEGAISAPQKDGVLTVELVSNRLANLGLSGSGLEHVYQVLSVPGRNLSDVSVLCNYVHLRKLDLSHNKIKDISCVSHMPHLIRLDASHNHIADFFGFQPPRNLEEVNLSHNHLTQMKDLSAYSSLSKLKLDYNRISEISGLQQCCRLKHLSLAHNLISCITGLDHLPLQRLCLKGNQVQRMEGLSSLRSLQIVDLSSNRISSLFGLQNLYLLGSINLENNLISDIKEATHIHDLFLLRELNLQKNPVQDQPDYRLSIIFLLQHLSKLDQKAVTAEEKVSSVNKYDPPMEVVAARDHMTQLVYQLMQPQLLYHSTLPSIDSPYPMLVLTGPQACGKRELAHTLCQQFNQYFAYGACHTTRGPYYGEEDGSDYHFISEEDFQNMVHMGRFVQTMQYGGHRYGLTRDTIEDVAREGLACCVHMELEGVLSLKSSYFEPRYVLLIPTEVERYAQRLRSRELYSPGQIEGAVARIELYARTNREWPGFFDSVIPCDDPEEAYHTLRKVMKEYLGLEEEQAGSDLSDHGETSDQAPRTQRLDCFAVDMVADLEPAPEEKTARPGSGPGGLEMDDPSCRTYVNKVQAQLRTPKTSTELASIRRREKLVRGALQQQHSPAGYSHMFTRSAQTAPASLTSQGRDPDLPTAQHSHDVCEDSGSDGSRVSSAGSVPSSARACSQADPPPGAGADPPPGSGAGADPPPGSGAGADPPPGSGAGADPPPGSGAGADPPPGSGAGADPPPGSGAGADPPPGSGAGADPPPGSGAGADPPPGSGAGADPPPGSGAGADPPPGSGAGVEPLDAPTPGPTLEERVAPGQSPEAPPRQSADHHHPPSPVASPSSSSRPGSDTKPVLPPIPCGRKTPAPTSPPAP